MASNKMISVPCTVFWCNPHRADNYGFISGTFGLLDDATVKELKDAGLKVKFDTDNQPDDENFQGFNIKARSDTPVPCRDSEGNPLPSKLFLGNGTKATAIIEAREWISKKHSSSGIKAVFRAIKITELVAYDPDAAAKAKAEAMLDADTSGGGFVFGEAAATEDSTEGTDTAAVDNEEFDRLFGETA